MVRNILSYSIFASLLFLCVGVLTSKSILSISHVLIMIPCVYFLFKTDWKKFSPSMWALLGMSLAIVLSVIVNQDTITSHMYGATRSKYFFIGILSVAPFAWYFSRTGSERSIKILLYALCLSVTFATIAGLVGQFTGYNPILFKEIEYDRNGGLFGQLLNYAHNLSYFLIILLGLLLNKSFSSRYANYKFLVVIFIINCIGLYFTYSRGPWLGFYLAIPFLFICKRKTFAMASISVLALGALTYFLAGSHMKRSDSDTIRIAQWKAAIEMVKDKPFFGVGYLNYEDSVKRIKKENKIEHSDFKSHAHNNVMEMLASVGIIGFFFFAAWIFLWALEMWKVKTTPSIIVLAFIICFLIGGLTQSTILVGVNLFFIMGVYSISQVVVRKSKN